MAMPKTAIHENSHLGALEYKVGFAKKPRLSSPSSDSMLTKYDNKFELRIAITPASDVRHHF